jgi:hypothetical protein
MEEIPAKRQKTRLTLEQMLARLDQVGNSHKSRDRIVLDHLKAAGIYPAADSHSWTDLSTPIMSFLGPINEYRRTNQLPLLKSIYDKGV